MAPLWSCLFQQTAGLCDVYVYEDNRNLNAPPGTRPAGRPGKGIRHPLR